MKKRLTEGELHALSGIIDVEIPVILTIKKFLDVKKVRTALIQEEFLFLSKAGNYKKKQIISALMEKYNMSKSYIEQIVYPKINKKPKQKITPS